MADPRCERCGRPARGGEGSPDARMMRRAQRGACVDCSAVLFLQRLMNMTGRDCYPDMPNCLRLPHVQEQFANVMRVGNADAVPDEINWERVIALWDIAPTATGTLF